MKSKWFWDNIYQTRDERVSFIFLNGILLIFILIKLYFVWFYQPAPESINADILAAITYEEEVPAYKPYIKQKSNTPSTNWNKPKAYKKKKDKKVEKHYSVKKSFDFNPNTISEDSLKMLGLSRYTINSLLKYRSKGGKINSKEQFERFNGLDKPTIDRLTEHILLPVSKKKVFTKKKYTSNKSDSIKSIPKFKYKKKQPRIIDINSADTTDFMNLYGIGKVYSKRIIAYRSSLGGFFEINQIKEVWGITDSLYQTLVPYLKVDTALIEKRNINEMTKQELGKHKYVGWFKSKMIMAYKKSHGDYKSMDDFKKLHALTKADVDTLKIYFDIR